MARPISGQEPVASILDRLIGLGADAVGKPSQGRYRKIGRLRRIEAMVRHGSSGRAAIGQEVEAIEWIVASVKEDLRCLLNERRLVEGFGPEDPLSQSLLSFGLDDMGHRSLVDLRRGGELRESVREAIARFEPRLSDIEVRVNAGGDSDYELRLSISARLNIDKEPRPVAFDTVMHLSTREITVTGGSHGPEAGGTLPE